MDTTADDLRSVVRHPDRFFIGGEWVAPSSSASFGVIDSVTERPFISVAEARERDMARAIAAARAAFDDGPWPRLSHAERAESLRAIASQLRERASDFAQVWPRESGVLYKMAQYVSIGSAGTFDYYAGLAETFPFEEQVAPMGGGYGVLVREPVGVVGAIIPWNGPLDLICQKIAPALLAGCSVVVKSSPEAPIEGYIMAEIAESVGLPPGVLNIVTADREVSELLVRDPRIDKIAFTGSTAAGRRIASICGERIARCTLELGGKSAAVILDDADIATAAASLAKAGSVLAGQVCAALTRVIVSRSRHEEMVEALAAAYSHVQVGDPFESTTEMGPLVTERQRDRVLNYIEKGKADGAVVATGGGRPEDLSQGYFVEPTVFANVDNSSTIAQEEIFGPVLTVIAADDEDDSVRLANDSIYGLNAAVFTDDLDRARQVAGALKSGTVGHNGFRIEPGISFGGYKQSGIGREGGTEGLRPYLETKLVLLDGEPSV